MPDYLKNDLRNEIDFLCICTKKSNQLTHTHVLGLLRHGQKHAMYFQRDEFILSQEEDFLYIVRYL